MILEGTDFMFWKQIYVFQGKKDEKKWNLESLKKV